MIDLYSMMVLGKSRLSAIECIITPYSTTKEFKKNRDVVVKELFNLYNSTIFENKVLV